MIAQPQTAQTNRHTEIALWVGLLALTALLYPLKESIKWGFKYPRDLIIPLPSWISDFMKWLYNDATFGLFTFKELTRGISWLVEWPLWFAKSLFSSGFTQGFGSEAVQLWPPISWIALIGTLMIMARYATKDWRLSILVGGCFLYLAVFGQWDSAMVTLSSIAIAVPVGVAGGLLLGIAAFRYPSFEKVLTPVLDLMQTVPVFAYLVPILVLFGFNPIAAMIATIIYAMPPMTRNTLLALRRVPQEIIDFGEMAGCSKRQMMWKVMIPSSRQGLMVGVNQVIMLSLNMVIIASMIGAGGLGHDVLRALRRLDFGAGLEAAIAITLLAIALDRLSQAFSKRQPPGRTQRHVSVWKKYPYLLMAFSLIAGTWLVGLFVLALQNYPESLEITTGAMVNDTMRWININFFEVTNGIKSWMLLNLMIPFKRFLLGLPWPAVIAMVALAGWRLGGWRLALMTSVMALFIVVTGLWHKAMITIYLCGISVVIACLIGIPIGIWAAGNDRINHVVQGVIDTLQTLPAFAYLMPVVMLFQVGDFSAMLAVIAYAIVPSIRYTIHGIRQIEPALIEAATAAGATPWQTLRRVKLPLALPEIMLGVNQTIMMALSMLVITALVGTSGLGQEVYIALTKADIGRGVVAGLCVAFIAIISDRLIQHWSTQRKKRLGLDQVGSA